MVQKIKKITFQDLLNAKEVFFKITNTPMPFKISYRLKKIIEKVIRELRCFEDARVELVKKYCEKDDKGEPVTKENGGASFTSENIARFNMEYSELIKTEADIEFSKIPLEILESADIKISAGELIALEKFIDE